MGKVQIFSSACAISSVYVYRFVLSEQPADLSAGEGDGLGGQSCGVDVAAHQNIHLLFRLHLRLLDGGGRARERERVRLKTHIHTCV